jgi:hypothetical protein
VPQADEERLPLAQQTMTGRSLNLSISDRRLSNWAREIWRALVMWPADHSLVSRTSTTTASSRLSSIVASVTEMPPAAPPLSIGMISMPPLIRASMTQVMFS